MKKWLPIVTCVWSFAAMAAEPAPPAEPAAEEKPAKPAEEDLSATAGPAVRTSAEGQQAAESRSSARPQGNDRLELDTTIVTGNRELPKVLYIVPWKRADLGELPSQPFNSLLDEILQPVDRDVFRREVTYFGVISTPDAAPIGESAAKQQ